MKWNGKLTASQEGLGREKDWRAADVFAFVEGPHGPPLAGLAVTEDLVDLPLSMAPHVTVRIFSSATDLNGLYVFNCP